MVLLGLGSSKLNSLFNKCAFFEINSQKLMMVTSSPSKFAFAASFDATSPVV